MPKTVNPRMRSSSPTSAFRKPRVSDSVRRTQYRSRGYFEEAVGNALCLCFALAKADPCQLRIGEHRERHLSPGGDAGPAAKVCAQNAEVVEGDVGELRAAGYLATSPYAFGRGAQVFIHGDIAAVCGLYAGELQAQSFCIGCPAGGDEEMGS